MSQIQGEINYQKYKQIPIDDLEQQNEDYESPKNQLNINNENFEIDINVEKNSPKNTQKASNMISPIND